MPKQLTVRGVSDELGRRLTRMSREQGQSVNTTLLRILEQAAGIDDRRRRLGRYATWSAADTVEFDRALADQRTLDNDLWQDDKG